MADAVPYTARMSRDSPAPPRCAARPDGGGGPDRGRRRRRPGLAAIPRSGQPGDLAGARCRRVERGAQLAWRAPLAGPRHLVPDRHRAIASSSPRRSGVAGQGRPIRCSPATIGRWPSGSSRSARPRASPPAPRGVRGRGVRSRRGRRLWEYRTAPGPRRRCTRSTTWRRRPRSPTANASMPGSAMDSWSRSTWGTAVGLVAPSWRRLRALRDAVGTRQLADAPRRSRILLCDHRTRVSARGRCAHRQGRWKVDAATAACRTARRWCRRPPGAELLVNSSARIDAYDPPTGAALVRRQRAADADPFRGVSRRPDLPEPRLSQQRLHGDSARRRRRRHANARRMAGPAGASYVPSILFYDGFLYMTNEVGVVTCADARPARSVAAASGRHLLRLASGRRRQGLHGQRNRRDIRAARRAHAGGAGDERPRRAVPCFAGDRGRADLPARRPIVDRDRPVEPAQTRVTHLA